MKQFVLTKRTVPQAREMLIERYAEQSTSFPEFSRAVTLEQYVRRNIRPALTYYAEVYA